MSDQPPIEPPARSGTRRAPRLYCSSLPPARLSDALCTLDADQTRHARKVLRLDAGDALELFDGRGKVAQAVLERFVDGRAACRVEHVRQAPTSSPRIIVAAAMPKGPRAEAMIDTLSQAGADRLVPVRTRRSVVDPRPSRIERFRARAVESAKQSGRPYLLEIDPPMDLGTALTTLPADVRLIAAPGEHFVNDLPRWLAAAAQVVVVIGPEGGWDDDELASAKQAGFEPWSFSPNVLRMELAATAAVLLLRYLTIR